MSTTTVIKTDTITIIPDSSRRAISDAELLAQINTTATEAEAARDAAVVAKVETESISGNLNRTNYSVEVEDANTIHVMQNGPGNRDVRHTLKREIDAGIKVDVWRVLKQQNYRNIGLSEPFGEEVIVDSSVFETAFQHLAGSGFGDNGQFTAGEHGAETIIGTPTFLVGNKPFTPTAAQEFDANEFRLIFDTEVFKGGAEPDTLLADVFKIIEFTPELEMKISHPLITWAETIDMRRIEIGMLPTQVGILTKAVSPPAYAEQTAPFSTTVASAELKELHLTGDVIDIYSKVVTNFPRFAGTQGNLNSSHDKCYSRHGAGNSTTPETYLAGSTISSERTYRYVANRADPTIVGDKVDVQIRRAGNGNGVVLITGVAPFDNFTTSDRFYIKAGDFTSGANTVNIDGGGYPIAAVGVGGSSVQLTLTGTALEAISPDWANMDSSNSAVLSAIVTN